MVISSIQANYGYRNVAPSVNDSTLAKPVNYTGNTEENKGVSAGTKTLIVGTLTALAGVGIYLAIKGKNASVAKEAAKSAAEKAKFDIGVNNKFIAKLQKKIDANLQVIEDLAKTGGKHELKNGEFIEIGIENGAKTIYWGNPNFTAKRMITLDADNKIVSSYIYPETLNGLNFKYNFERQGDNFVDKMPQVRANATKEAQEKEELSRAKESFGKDLLPE